METSLGTVAVIRRKGEFSCNNNFNSLLQRSDKEDHSSAGMPSASDYSILRLTCFN